MKQKKEVRSNDMLKDRLFQYTQITSLLLFAEINLHLQYTFFLHYINEPRIYLSYQIADFFFLYSIEFSSLSTSTAILSHLTHPNVKIWISMSFYGHHFVHSHKFDVYHPEFVYKI
jgi:hypothetical protein